MRTILRLGVTVIATVMSWYFIFWIAAGLLAAILPRHQPGPITVTLAIAIATVCAAALARAVWRITGAGAGTSPGLAGAMLRGALIVGVIGFIAGFIGPIVFTPGASQGPLRGIFITGPLGLVIGAIAGAIRWRVNRSARNAPT